MAKLDMTNLLPKKTTAEMNATTPASGERPMIYNTDEEAIFYWNGTDWVSAIDGMPEE